MPMKLPPNVVNQDPVRGRLLLYDDKGRELPIVQDVEDRTFPAGTPQDPYEERGAEPRVMVPPPFVNLLTSPRRWPGQTLTPFQQLRSLADFDLLRCAIDDVRGQILGMNWDIAPRDEFKKQADDEDMKAEIAAAQAWVRMPDRLGGLDFRSWLGRCVEEVLVTDALALYPRYSRGGEPLGLEQLDGATIIPLVDNLGRPPLPPEAAYQQIVHGRPETEFVCAIDGNAPSPEELWYMPSNRRSESPYGRSKTESVLMSVNLAIRHYTFDLSYYTSGSLPDAVYALPAQMTPLQLDELQTWWDAVLTGRSDRRSGGMRFVPEGTLHELKTRDWQYEFLEWLARVIAWEFGVSALPIMKAIGRNPSEELGMASLEKGIRPLADFMAAALNRYITRILGLQRVEFVWGGDETEDAAQTVARNTAYAGIGAITLNAIRKQIGEDPYDPELGDEPIMMTPTGPVFLNDLVEARKRLQMKPDGYVDPAYKPPPGFGATPGAPSEADDEAGKPPGPPGPPGEAAEADEADEAEESPTAKWRVALAAYHGRVVGDLAKRRRKRAKCRKAGKAARFVSRYVHPWLADRDEIAKAELPLTAEQQAAEKALEDAVMVWLTDQWEPVLQWAVAAMPPGATGKVAKFDLPSDPPLNTRALYEMVQGILTGTFNLGAADTIAAMGVELDLAPLAAEEYAAARAAELVGMKLIGGELVVNPNAAWSITDSLRADINGWVNQAITEGWSPQELASRMRPEFDRWRAHTVARTETGLAYGSGAREVYSAAEVELVEIIDGPGCLPDGHRNGAPAATGAPGVVEAEHQANGQVWTLAQYEAHPLGHPNCVRAAVPYFGAE